VNLDVDVSQKPETTGKISKNLPINAKNSNLLKIQKILYTETYRNWGPRFCFSLPRGSHPDP